jgi:hypothetical protein
MENKIFALDSNGNFRCVEKLGLIELQTKLKITEPLKERIQMVNGVNWISKFYPYEATINIGKLFDFVEVSKLIVKTCNEFYFSELELTKLDIDTKDKTEKFDSVYDFLVETLTKIDVTKVDMNKIGLLNFYPSQD